MNGNYIEKINKAIEKFHEKYYPEGIVEFIGESEDGKIAFEFSGHMCLTCGVEDYFEDFRIILSNVFGEEIKIYKKFPADEENTVWIVIYARGEVKEEPYKMKYLVIDPEKEEEVEIEVK